MSTYSYKDLDFQEAYDYLASSDNCTFRGRTPYCSTFSFSNGNELALESRHLDDSKIVTVWVPKSQDLESYFDTINFHPQEFKSGENRSAYIGNRLFARQLATDKPAYRVQFKHKNDFLAFIRFYGDEYFGNKELEELEMILRRNPLQVNQPHRDTGETPLMIAAKSGKLSWIRLLAKYGADPYLKDKLGKSAIDYALEASRECYEYLLSMSTVGEQNQSEHQVGTILKEQCETEIKYEHADELEDDPDYEDEDPINFEEDLEEQSIITSKESPKFQDEEVQQFGKPIIHDDENAPTFDLEKFNLHLSVDKRLTIIKDLKQADMSDKLKALFFGIQSGWTNKEMIALYGKAYILGNYKVLKALYYLYR